MTEGSTSFGSKLNTSMKTNISPDEVGTQFLDILPWVGGMVIVAFVIYEAKKLIKGASRAKVRL